MYKSRKAGKRNRKSGGHKHFDKVGVKTVVKPEVAEKTTEK
ncbi:hypothetical protein [Lactococcus fujiensis]|uniref:Uncharacterized protein n=1 Tax=Lactococcus fujiensis JCM 16395 TaxID=1291764 RepID=A0A2A5RPZ5_9LACT|nr:hypothetical protein [Lactococcus fujiensis]PCS01515.1 hypothetical protein RT41_GL000279 [Lactococcus fujiensis JCM 16395]